jgi:hypothetical protein
MALLRITKQIPWSVPDQLFQLLHGGRLSIGGVDLYCEQTVPVEIVREADHLRYCFNGVTAETPGPNQAISEIFQYADRIEISIPFWAKVTLRPE